VLQRAEVKQILWWLIAGSKGGINRARIILALYKRPYNANQLSRIFDLDYKTIRHHLDILKKHNLIISIGEGYGTVYFLSENMKAEYKDFLDIWMQIDVPAELREE
jgi:DNA-binding transcriptional ArsR family regulator